MIGYALLLTQPAYTIKDVKVSAFMQSGIEQAVTLDWPDGTRTHEYLTFGSFIENGVCVVNLNVYGHIVSEACKNDQ